MNIKWKDIYSENRKRTYCKISNVKEENITVESNSFRILKEKKYPIIIVALIIIALLFYTFRNDLKIFLIVLAFFLIAGLLFTVFNYFKLTCMKDGLYIKYGFQQGKFNYERIDSVFLSRYNDTSFLFPSISYNLVIRYTDNFKRIRELSFPSHFLSKEETIKFLNNFEIEEQEVSAYINHEKFKLFKRIAKSAAFILLIICIIYLVIARSGISI